MLVGKSTRGHTEKTMIVNMFSLAVIHDVHAFLPFSFLFCPPCRNLSNNRITDIEEGTFEGASGVNELILTSNKLENIHHHMLKGLGGLRTLWVHTLKQNLYFTHINLFSCMNMCVCVYKVC